MGKPLLSIVVPTKDRYKYLKYLIELVADFNSDEIELIIQDNSDNNTEFVDYLKGLQFNFIRYSHVQGQIPMAINSDRAILNSTGDFICFLGDDDGLTKYAIDCARWMKQNDIEAVKSAEVIYSWPDIRKETISTRSSSIKYKVFTGKICYLDPYNELLKVLRKGIVNRGDMPLVYHNIVSRKALDKVYEKCGTYFPGNSPDISNAVALSLTIKKYVIINLPLAFSGCSVYNGGGVYAEGRKGEPRITEIPWFRPNVEENWNKMLPRIASPSLIWADSAMSALAYMNRDDLYSEINFYKLYAFFVIKNPKYHSITKNFFPNKFVYYSSLVSTFLNIYISGAFRRLKVILGIIKIKENINNTKEASLSLEKIISTCNIDPDIFVYDN